MIISTALSAGACGQHQAARDGSAGEVHLALTATGVGGATFRLRGATFEVSGPTTTSLSTETNPESALLTTELPAGEYSILLAQGWRLERVDGGAPVTVVARFLSPNPQAVTVRSATGTRVVFRFQVGDDQIDFDPGRLEIGIEVAPAGYGYVMNRIVLPTSAAQASLHGLNLDGASEPAVDNNFGALLATLVTLLSDAAPDFQGASDREVATGAALNLVFVRTPSLVTADSADVGMYLGGNPRPMPCLGANDDQCGRHLDGAGLFDIDPQPAVGPRLPGSVLLRSLTAGPGTVRVRIPFAAASVLTFQLVGARVHTAEIDANGFMRGTLGGGLTRDQVDGILLPALQRVLGMDEIAAHASLAALLAPDLDLFDGQGTFNPGQDGVMDAMSLGIAFSAEFRFGAIVIKDDAKLPIPGAVVANDGSAVTIGRRSEDPKKPSFNVKCQIEAPAPGKLSAHFTVIVDKQNVASETIALDRALKELVLTAHPYVFAIEIAPFEKGASPLTSARLIDEQLKTAEAQHDREILARAGLPGETRFKASWAKFSFSHPKAWTAERMMGSSMMMTLVDPEKFARDGAQKNMAGVALFAAQLDWPPDRPESDRPQALREMATIKHDDDAGGTNTTTVSAPVLVKVAGLMAYAVELADPSHGSGGRTYFVGGKYRIYQLSFTYYDWAAPALTPAQQKVLGSFRELAR